VTAALTAFGQSYFRGSKSKPVGATRKKRTISVAGRKKIAVAQRARWAKIKGQKVVFNQCPPRTHNVRGGPQKDCQSSESSLGKVAEGTKGSLDSRSITLTDQVVSEIAMFQQQSL